MLVLSRRTEEAIVIGDNITVTVLGIEGDRVRLGIDAPRSMRIFRRELLLETRDANKEAVQTALTDLTSSVAALKKSTESNKK